MINNAVALVALIALMGAVSPVQAMPPFATTSVANPGGQTVNLPDHAIEIAPGIFSLGFAVASDGRVVEGIAIVHPKNEHAKGGKKGKPGGGGGGTTSSCFAYIAKDAKWKSVEDWVVNTSNLDGLGSTFVFDILSESIAAWEDAADGTIDGIEGEDILGDGSKTTDVLLADMVSPDDVNEVYFADIADANVIGITIVWGIFSGRPANRELVEWDQVYDDVDYDWSEDAEGSLTEMDFKNIAMHEIGHSTGMTHPDATCTLETMFSTASEGETIKRNLHDGDIAGIDGLY
jgi:hypothetical protein